VTFEGKAAIELEWLAEGENVEEVYPFGVSKTEGAYLIDVRPLVQEVVREVEAGVQPGTVARRFHRSVAEVILTVCVRLRRETGINNVVLSGGVFMNSLLMEEATRKLEVSGFCPFHHRLVPTNDGGISLGLLAIAACRSATK
jgi:hydrogenase maturation protein HypF